MDQIDQKKICDFMLEHEIPSVDKLLAAFVFTQTALRVIREEVSDVNDRGFIYPELDY